MEVDKNPFRNNIFRIILLVFFLFVTSFCNKFVRILYSHRLFMAHLSSDKRVSLCVAKEQKLESDQVVVKTARKFSLKDSLKAVKIFVYVLCGPLLESYSTMVPLFLKVSELMFESKSMVVAFTGREGLCISLDGQTELALGRVMAVVCRKIASHLLIWSSLRSVQHSKSALCGFLVCSKGSVSGLIDTLFVGLNGVLDGWPIIRRYSSILLHSGLFPFVGGLSHFESRGGPSSVMLEPDKSRSFFSFFSLFM